MIVAEWVTAVGEILIALVIWWEMEEARRERFLAEAANFKNYQDRGKIYSAYYDTGGISIEDKSREFCNRIWKQNPDDIELKESCERQIVLFGRLGQISRRAMAYKRDYVRLFPHAVVLFWIMVGPYVEDRREMTGDWWASDFERLTKDCLDFLFNDNPNPQLKLYDRDRARKDDLIIPTTRLRDLRNELTSVGQRNEGRGTRVK